MRFFLYKSLFGVVSKLPSCVQFLSEFGTRHRDETGYFKLHVVK